MCGIIGYIGKKEPVSILLDGLKKLEYRGYDSAGVALKSDEQVQVVRSVGKIDSLTEKISSIEMVSASMGIAHTRWATHGVPSEENAHPHMVGKVTLVHNGIIENAGVLRDALIGKGVSFQSETDTEVVAALINYYYQGDVIFAITEALKLLQGSYALGILFSDQNELYAVRKDSPLVIGISDDGYFITSDISAINAYTNQYVLLEEGEIAKLGDTAFSILKDGKGIEREICTTNNTSISNEKDGYEHYMLKEMMEEPEVLEKIIASFTQGSLSLPDISSYQEIHIVACGSAMYAGMIGKNLLEEHAAMKVICEVASEYRYRNIIYDQKTLVLLISQSGETADTIAAMRKATEQGIDTLAIVNVRESTIARESKAQIFIDAGPEIAVATTKAYLLQVAVLSLLSYQTATLKKLPVPVDFMQELVRIPNMLEELFEQRESYFRIAQDIYQAETVFFLGRKIDYAVSLEGSLKLKEVSYIHSEAYQAGELKHGTISLIEEGMPVFVIVTDDDIRAKTISNMVEVKSRGAKVIMISNEKVSECDICQLIPKVNPFLQALLVVPCLQFIAYETAKLRGCDIDQPKNLAKSVTVE